MTDGVKLNKLEAGASAPHFKQDCNMAGHHADDRKRKEEEIESINSELARKSAQLEIINHELNSAKSRLRIHEMRLQAILDNSPNGIWLVDMDAHYQFVNKTFCNAIGRSESEFLAARHLGDIMGPEAANCLASDRACLEQDAPHLSHETLTFVDGKQHLLEITKVKLRDSTGAVTGVIGTAIDITEQREREAALAASQEQLREAEQRQALARERQRLMQDMHDGLESSLVNALREVERGELGGTEVAEILKNCIDDHKLAIDSLEPVETDLLLLLATLRFRLEPRLEVADIALRWEVNSVPALDWLDPRNSLHILRLLHEAFIKIIKHSHTTEVRVATATDGNHVVVTVSDNGPGFDAASVLESCLSNQLRRAEVIGAEARWMREATGMCFTLRLPVRRTTGMRG